MDAKKLFASACRQGNQKRIKQLVEEGSVDPTGWVGDSVDPNGDIPLHLSRTFLGCACEGGDVDTIKLMIDTYGCDPEGRYPNNYYYYYTPLQEACMAGRSKAVDLLVGTYHCDMYTVRYGAMMAFDMAVGNGRLDVVDLLLKTHKYDPNHRNSKGRTPLHTAATYGSSEVMKKLIETYKVDPECKDDEGRTPLHSAVEYGRNEVMKELIETCKADPECKDDEGHTPLACAVANDKRTTATLLIDECKCDLQCRDSKGYNLLHLAAVNGRSGIAALLVTKYKFDPNVKAADGSTPLHLTEHSSTARELIQHGADVNARDNLGHTPLHNAYMISYQPTRNEMTKLLIFSGSDAQLCDKNGYTPLGILKPPERSEATRKSQREQELSMLKEEMPECSLPKEKKPKYVHREQGVQTDPVTTPASCDFITFRQPSSQSLTPARKRPTLEKIKSLGVDVIGGIGTDYHNFGIQLLHDPNGVRVQGIKHDCRGNCEEINTAIIVRWLKGGEKGRPVTWAVLCEALRNAGLVTLAEEVSETLVRKLLS